MMRAVSSKIADLIHHADSIVVASHIRPDGDAMGSLIGLGLALTDAGKKVQMVMADGVPLSYDHLPGKDQITRKIKDAYDLSIILDCADLARAGGVFEDREIDICIDHHITNMNYARINLVDPEAVATAAILAEKLPEWNLKITQPVAEALLTGLVSDTIGFRTSNMTSQALRLAAILMDAGANLSALYHRALVQRSFESARYWGYGLQNLQKQGRMAWTTLSLDNRKEASYPGNDDADLNNILSTIEGCDVSVLFIEQKKKHVKVSWRAQPGFDVSKIALQFGGGGHPAAAGADIPGELEEVQNRVLEATRIMLVNNIR